MTVEKKVLPQELIDGLLANYKRPEDLIGEDGLPKQHAQPSNFIHTPIAV